MITETTTPEDMLRAIHFDFNLIPYGRWIREVSIIKGRGDKLTVRIVADHSTRDFTEHIYEFYKTGARWGGYEISYVAAPIKLRRLHE